MAMTRNDVNKHARMLGTAVRALTGFFAGLVEGSKNEKRAAATLFRKAESERNPVTLGGIANIANNVLQAIPALDTEGKSDMRSGVGSDKGGVVINSRTTDDFYVYGRGCEIDRVVDGARSKAIRFLELYRAFKDVEAGEAVATTVEAKPAAVADDMAKANA